ncbi:LINE-1 retrotransposable element ORF2 protein [Vitis vinifera]|uniref:LINE-1 retrotransposable element ORF2 protein n=1 Tax=Vitis vinifera TaxID=29760 RepID=A0A438BUQ8_VITVI|nr:LINE-1 retrotransposable element ORF2 protein [Vitis vinifera]
MIQETKKGFRWDLDYLGLKKLRSEEVVIGSFSVSVKFDLDGCGPLWISAVYGPNSPSLRKNFSVELLDIFGLSFPLWCVGGDFNVIRRSSEKLGGSRLTSSMKDFDCFIRECELLDRLLRNASFTWSNMQESPVCLQEALPRRTSDHWPIVLDSNPFKWGPTPFRFENNAESITEEILLYFEKLYASPTGESWSVEGLDWFPISEESASRLDSPFTEEEISRAIFQLDRDKAPGPNDFTIAVFQDCLDVIEDLVRVFAEFHRSRIINQSTNASFIVLLPKKSLTKDISDFRPISLITSLYKIIAKVLSGRLRGVLHETIHSTQGAFVQGRQILDAVLIANEVVDEKRRSGEEGVVFKIDFEKAYDHGGLRLLKGLRQGDPLSPFLFTLVADVLSKMLLRAEERNLLEGFKVGRNRTRVSHLQFADGTIFFSNTKEEDLQTLKSLLLVFGHISGFKVNLDKSNIYGINLDQNHLSRLAELLDCKASGWPILYLGLPLGENPKACGFWDPMIERISRRLDGWQKAYLSFGGRITLIQSCLTHMPCYFLSLFKIPASVAAKLRGKRGIGIWEDFSKESRSLREMVVESDGHIVVLGRLLHKSFRSFPCLLDSEIEDLEGLMRSLDGLHLSPSVSDARS